jgi:2-polyprenyl-6-methoxyphenol hydroxylase-like FAD-dependent oxidoreductase
LILAYFIPGPDGGTEPGSRRLNWVWYDTLDGQGRSEVFTDSIGVQRQYTVPPGRLRDAIRDRRLRRAASTLPPAVRDIVAATPQLFVQAIYDRTVPEMVVDRVCLLGDAAFVARPHTAAGTAKAVADGTALAAALTRHETVTEALASWNDTRTAAGNRLVDRGKRMGDDRLAVGRS